MRRVGMVLLVLSLASLAQAGNPQLGTVNFQTSCKGVSAEFNHAVALLHSFEYDEARDAFAALGQKEPSCAMAKWGEAMSWFHGLWGEFNATAGAKAAADARRLASANPATAEREKQFIGAISEIYSEAALQAAGREENKPDSQGYSEPDRKAEEAYANRMAALHAAYPKDVEATIFYALALDGTRDTGDKTHARERQCVALLEPLFAQLPNHPGIAHYLIHCNDNPDMAAQGLTGARVYAKIAPASAHATHMPAHIFAQLGLWDEMIASNRLSLRAAEEDTRQSVCQRAGHELHAMQYLTFGLLQSGQLNEARRVVEQAKQVNRRIAGADRCPVDESLVVATYVLETGEWARAGEIALGPSGYSPSMSSGMLWLVKGIAAAASGDATGVKAAEDQLGRRASPKQHCGGGADSGAEAMRLAIAAWSAQQAGHKDDALSLLRRAAEMQERLGADNSVAKPLREMLADLLLRNEKPREAGAEYQAVLSRHPNRFNSLYGAGTATEKDGDAAAAREYFGRLLKVAPGDERPELETARKAVGAGTNAGRP